MRMGFSNPHSWIEIESANPEDDDSDAEEVREVYMCAVLRLDLPIDSDLMDAMRRYFVPAFLAQYPQTNGNEYKQGF